jgi:p-hydroxybenzoate 3-monooxygenase
MVAMFEGAYVGRRHRIDLTDLTDLTELTGKAITLDPRHEVIKDLVAARIAAGGQLLFAVGEVSLHAIDTRRRRCACRMRASGW